MKRLLQITILVLVALALAGCTYVKYDTGKITYLSVLQKKALSAEMDPQGKVTSIKYDTNSDAVVELARSVETLSSKIAVMGAAK